jgi:phosphoglycerol transferase MdoB-like AlkP superfamily enzyme
MPGNLRLLAKRFILILALYSICRLLFYLFNVDYFSGAGNVFLSFISGLRFDITAVIIGNLPFIVLHFNPFSFFYAKWYQVVLKILFVVINSVCLLANIIDIVLFRFTGKRATADVFNVMAFGEDMVNTLPQMILDFWYLVLLFAILVFLLIRIYNRITVSKTKNRALTQTVFYILAFAFIFIGFRGGIQYRPINIMTASQHGSVKMVALILNTPFSVIKTLGKEELPAIKYFTDEEAEQISPTLHTPSSGDSIRMKGKNVVIIIMESIGKEYVGGLNNQPGYTPFLDSLMKQSLVFTDAYANGKRSMEGIPAVVAGIPALMNEPFVTSAYNGNQITSIPRLLKEINYSSAFFHGGTNGTMNFDNFSQLAGFDRYIGRKEYNNDKDFDGSWGIYDEPFFQFAAADMSMMQQPFVTAIFSLSSHHPYSIPEKYKTTFKKGTLPIHQSVLYADYSLKRFFESASKMPWYNNTLFIITADHSAISEQPKYQTKVGLYSIPMVFYTADKSFKGESAVTIQQIDIMPTVLNIAGYDRKYFSFGNDVFDTTSDHFAISFLNDNYQIISNGYSFSMDTANALSLYYYRTDSLLQNNLLNTDTAIQRNLERRLKGFIQNYNRALIDNKMTVQKEYQSSLNKQ